jgi:hypothetical protein
MTFSYSRYNPQIKLSTEEMLEISQEINREFAPEFSNGISNLGYQHKLSPKEMFEISEEIRKDFAPRASSYIQELVLLPVDPDHLYAYWNLDDDKLDTTQKNDSRNQLTLRIYPEPNKNWAITKTKSWFDIAIDSAQAQQIISLPMRAHETDYSATIGNRYPDNGLVPFAYSNITHVPRGKAISDKFKENEIVFGIDEGRHIGRSTTIPDNFKESELVFESISHGLTGNREISIYTNRSASGRGNN